MARVLVVGGGFVGLTTAVALAEGGHDVTLWERDPARLERLRELHLPFFEPGLQEAFARQVKLGALHLLPSGHLSNSIQIAFLCVGTPSQASGAIDLEDLRRAAIELGRTLKDRSLQPIVAVKSTVVPGTARGLVAPAVYPHLAPVERNALVCSTPEFLREGTALNDARKPNRIVLGCGSPEVAKRIADLFPGDVPTLLVPPETAEMVKYASNAFLATKISFANELADLCSEVGVDWRQVLEGMTPDPRIGTLFMQPGAGFGGSCFPKDVRALRAFAKAHGHELAILGATLSVNERQPRLLVDWTQEVLGTLHGRIIAVLGLSFKEGTDDLRESRAIPIVRELLSRGAQVRTHDPKALSAFAELRLGDKPCLTVAEAIDGADAVLLQTAWPEYRALSPDDLKATLRTPVVIDGRRLFDAAQMRASGFHYRAVGVPHN